MKTLFKKLSISDLIEIYNEFDKIYKDNKAVASILTNHTIIQRKVLDSSSNTDTTTCEENHEFEQVHRTKYHFDNAEENYQNLLDISEITLAVIKGIFTYVVQILVL